MPVLGTPKSGSRRCAPREGRVAGGKVWRGSRDCLEAEREQSAPSPTLCSVEARVPFHPWRRRRLVEADLSVYGGSLCPLSHWGPVSDIQPSQLGSQPSKQQN